MTDAPAIFPDFDIDAEQSLLATIFRNPSALAVAAAELEPTDFYDALHQRIFEKMLVLDELDRPITVVTLNGIMRSDPGMVLLFEEWQLQQGASYFTVLFDRARLSVTLKEQAEVARQVAALRMRRDARAALDQAHLALDAGGRIDSALTPAVKVFDAAALADQRRAGSPGIEAAFTKLAREVEIAFTTPQLRGLMTGWPKFDAILQGFQPESFTVAAGRPGMGKSIFGTSILAIAGAVRDADGNPVYDPTSFSLEMSQSENAARLIAEQDFKDCLLTGNKPMHYSAILKGKLTNEQFERFVLIGQGLRELGIDIFDESRMTMHKIASLARARAQLSTRKPLIVIDHLQIVRGGERYAGNRIDELTEITGSCKALAKRLSCPVIALSQLSRAVESRDDKRPVLADLRESGSIEQDADQVIFLYRPEYYLRAKLRHAQATKSNKVAEIMAEEERARNVLDVDIAKNRHGAVGDARLWIDVASGVIRDDAPGDGGPQQSLALGAEPLDGMDDLAKRTGG